MARKAIATTRFTSATYLEFCRYGQGNGGEHWYGSPRKAPQTIDLGRGTMVIEMNNTENEVMGIGFIVDDSYGRRRPIYSEPNWCRHTYRREAWLSPEELQEELGEEHWGALQRYLFKSIHNQKRWSGITGWNCHDPALEAALLGLRGGLAEAMDAARLAALNSAGGDRPPATDVRDA